jgi:hypothetical protein
MADTAMLDGIELFSIEISWAGFDRLNGAS